MDKKAISLTLSTVIVLIILLFFLIMVIAFLGDKLSGMLGGLGLFGTNVSQQLNESGTSALSNLG